MAALSYSGATAGGTADKIAQFSFRLPSNWDGTTAPTMRVDFQIGGSSATNGQVYAFYPTGYCSNAAVPVNLSTLTVNVGSTAAVTVTTAGGLTTGTSYAFTLTLPTTGCTANSVYHGGLARVGGAPDTAIGSTAAVYNAHISTLVTLE
jgi:hypothetical protein